MHDQKDYMTFRQSMFRTNNVTTIKFKRLKHTFDIVSHMQK